MSYPSLQNRILEACLLAASIFTSCQPKMDDAAAIRQLLEKESATWRSGDFEAHADCWLIQPYSRILVSNGKGEVFDVPPGRMKDPSAKMGDGGSSANYNYKMSIQENHAWVNHDEVSTDGSGVKTVSSEIRLLEKVDGQWKLVGQSIHIKNQ